MRTLLPLVAQLVLATTPQLSAAGPAAAGPAAPSRWLEQAHAKALDLFRRGRFSEAYGRFIELAEVGHPASARYAVWMCENGTPLFGVDWDCAPHEMEAWRAMGSAAERRSGSSATARTR